MRSGNESVICCNSLYIGLWMLCTYCIERKDGQGKVFGREVVAASRSNRYANYSTKAAFSLLLTSI